MTSRPLGNELHDATPPGWFVGRPAYNEHKSVPWEQYDFDPKETPKVGHRSEGMDRHGHDRGRRGARDGPLFEGDQPGPRAEVAMDGPCRRGPRGLQPA